MRRKWVILCSAIFLIAALAIILYWPNESGERKETTGKKIDSDQQLTAGVAPQSNTVVKTNQYRTTNKPEKSNKKGTALVQKEKTPEQLKLEALDRYVSDENTGKALALLETLMYSDSVETRHEVADTLGWIGVRGLHLLTKMLGDPDSEVAESAFDHWLSAVSEVEDDFSKVELLSVGLPLIEDQFLIEEGFMVLDSMPDTLGVTCLLPIIENSDNIYAVEAALEQYQFTTDEEFTTVQRAEEWIDEQLMDEDAAL